MLCPSYFQYSAFVPFPFFKLIFQRYVNFISHFKEPIFCFLILFLPLFSISLISTLLVPYFYYSWVYSVVTLITFQLATYGDFPGGPMVKNLPSNAGNTGSIPGWGTKILHATGQLSLCATTTELARLN